MSLEQRLSATGRKRVLCIDGGGVRGIVALQYLEKMEKHLRKKNSPELVLSDYFDFVGGTSTGAIIAAGIAMGREVAWIKSIYETLCGSVFRKRSSIMSIFVPKFSDKALHEAARTHFNVAMGSPELKTGLLIVTRRTDTGSVWPFHNIPWGKFYSAKPSDSWIANSKLKVSDLLLASCSAPTYFQPREFDVGYTASGKSQKGVFVDGGVSPHNNPAWAMLKLLALEGYGLNWKLGPRNLQLFSIGTGRRKLRFDDSGTSTSFGIKCLKALMDDCADEVESIMQMLSNSPTARHMDAEQEDMSSDLLAGRQLLDYTRYNLFFENEWLSKSLGKTFSEDELEHLARMDEPGNLESLAELGRLAADLQVLESQFSRINSQRSRS